MILEVKAMNKRWRRIVVMLFVVTLTWTTLISCGAESSQYTEVSMSSAHPLLGGSGNVTSETAATEPTSWIVKWKQPGVHDEAIVQDSIIISTQERFGIMVMKPSIHVEVKDWLKRFKHNKSVEYIEPNHRVKSLSGAVVPNDTSFQQQHYLKQIGADVAWSQVNKSPGITIALVDTGVDIDHPDIKANLIPGVNLLEPGLPKDDNGHGTNVAGVIAAIGNNGKGTTGITWSAKILPIKALDSRGYGDEDKLGAGILYAVDHGAKIVVMSVGLYRYSKYMQDIVQYAEDKGVLLVAATGNDGTRYQEKVEVKYPAAYSSVLAIGGNTPQLTVEPRSNIGPEIDIVAPWHVYTTALGGGYKNAEGTSMAAPQVAGVAALLWSKYPTLKPHQIREHLRMTAQDILTKGWDNKSGYGMVRADKALLTVPKPEGYIVHQARNKARVFPIDTMNTGYLSDGQHGNWYRVEVPYDGTLDLVYQRVAGNSQIQAVHYEGASQEGKRYSPTGKEPMSLSVKKGVHYIRISAAQATKSNPITYKLSSRFRIAADPFEPNDKQYEAYALPARKQQVTGTFSHTGDKDWFEVQIPSRGTLTIKVTTDTVRIDPMVEVAGPDNYEHIIDDNTEGQTEMSVLSDLKPGKYYIRIQNAVTAKAEPVAGQYTMHLDFLTQYTDPNEPNDKMYEAVTITPNTNYTGVFHSHSDKDWFQLQLEEQAYINFELQRIPSNRTVEMSVFNKEQKLLISGRNRKGESKLEAGMKLEKGPYYIRLTANEKFDTNYYTLRATKTALVAGMRDIKGHWAQEAIVGAVKKGWIKGYADAQFAPNRFITRAEAATVMANAFKLTGSAAKPPAFADVPQSHWAYSAVTRVAEAHIAAGYETGRFAPARDVTRAETGVMIGNALHLVVRMPAEPPFVDVLLSHWAAPMLAELKKQQLIKGYEDGSFAPNRPTTRAEFVAMLYSVAG